MKKVKINNNKVVDLVRETLNRDGVFVADSKIDSVIKKYLSEREEMLLDDESNIEDIYSFSRETKSTLGKLVRRIGSVVEDLNIVQVREGDVLVGEDMYSQEYIDEIVTDLENVIERLSYIKGLE